jgi:5'-phosphate synthase pdxT subunit
MCRSRTDLPNAAGETLLSLSNGAPVVGVLALQGDVREHLEALTALGAQARAVRRPEELANLAGIILPGGESTTIDKLSRIFAVRDPLVAALSGGLPAYGSCAGMILLADRVLDGTDDQQTFGGLDITVRRNAFGRQVQSFEADVELSGVSGGPMHAVFIRAPWVEQLGHGVEVLGSVTPPGRTDAKVIAVRQGNLLATSFHPEVSGDLRIHRYFLDLTRAAA